MNELAYCSGLPDRTTLRHSATDQQYIEGVQIVPVFQTGLH